jgi:hypothetical protein
MHHIHDDSSIHPYRQQLLAGFAEFTSDIENLLSMPPVRLADADIPNTSGVYVLLVDGESKYVGEAKGSQGLRDRILNKHLSGDDSHAIQRAFKQVYPDRILRRQHVRNHVFVRWVVISDPARVSIVERIVIWLLCPSWNRR